MKLIKKITSLSLIILINMQLSLPKTYAQTKPEEACISEKERYEELVDEKRTVEIRSQNDYQDAFDEAQKTYHDYVGCMFNFAEETVLMLKDGETIIDWMKPKEACLKPDKIKEITKDTDPSQLLNPILTAHTKYENHLKRLGDRFDQTGNIVNEQGEPILESSLQLRASYRESMKRNRQLEIDSSLVAIDLMFTSMKELRSSLVMHVHFQCTLEILERYRKALADLREVVEVLPDKLENASLLK